MTAHISPGSMSEEVAALIPALRAFAHTFYRHPNDADDLVQETLVKALSNLDHFKEGTRLKSWLFTIMRNSFCTRYRIAKREIVGMADGLSLKRAVAPEQEWRVRGHELEVACASLPAKYRSAFEFIFIDGRSYEEAADHFHCPIGTIKSRVNRARRHLMIELEVPR